MVPYDFKSMQVLNDMSVIPHQFHVLQHCHQIKALKKKKKRKKSDLMLRCVVRPYTTFNRTHQAKKMATGGTKRQAARPVRYKLLSTCTVGGNELRFLSVNENNGGVSFPTTVEDVRIRFN